MNKQIQELVAEARMHTIFGLAFLFPAGLHMLHSALDVHISILSIMTPFILMFGAVVGLYLQTIRHMRVAFAKRALLLLTCGVSYGALYVGSWFLDETAGLFCATFVPYFYVRIVGHSLYKKDIALSPDEVLQANYFEF